MAEIHYLGTDEIIELNVLVLSVIKVKKADRHAILSLPKLRAALNQCEDCHGGIHHKAAALLSAIARAHAFASGNRRTAFVATKKFLEINKAKMAVADSPENASVLQGICEVYYSDDEIVEWIKNGKIRLFRR